jgi:hypothetical protein
MAIMNQLPGMGELLSSLDVGELVQQVRAIDTGSPQPSPEGTADQPPGA